MNAYKLTLHKDDYGYFRLIQFVGRGICKLRPYSLHSFGEKEMRILQVCRKISTKKLFLQLKNGIKNMMLERWLYGPNHCTNWRLPPNVQIKSNILNSLFLKQIFSFNFCIEWVTNINFIFFVNYVFNLINIIIFYGLESKNWSSIILLSLLWWQQTKG